MKRYLNLVIVLIFVFVPQAGARTTTFHMKEGRAFLLPSGQDISLDTTVLLQPTRPAFIDIKLDTQALLDKTTKASDVQVTTTQHQELINQETELSNLARDFNQALVAVNQNKDDIHVGHLMSACGKLETTIRKMGFGQSANDIASNLAKIQNVYTKMPAKDRDSMPALLKYELDSGMHSNHKPKESSATMGFLWLGRSINYQYDMFNHMLENEEATPYEAANHAYCSSLKPHLSWPLQKLCQTALRSIKPMQKNTIFAKIGGFPEESYGHNEDIATKNDLKEVLSSWKPMIQRWNRIFTEMGWETL